jgi:hypothetical protein
MSEPGGIVTSKISWSERLYRRFFHKHYARDLYGDLMLRAKAQSVDYIAENMTDAVMFRDRWAQLAEALRLAPAQGLCLEFGVQDGASINHMAALAPERTFHGFDSFEGLPEDWSGTFELKGKFSRQGALPAVRSNVQLHKGWFDKTLPEFLAETGEPVAFLHVDCDLYSSTHTVLELLSRRLVAGSVIIFDEYLNYPNWQVHEFRAFQEWCERHARRYRYSGFTAVNGHVMVTLLP